MNAARGVGGPGLETTNAASLELGGRADAFEQASELSVLCDDGEVIEIAIVDSLAGFGAPTKVHDRPA